MSTAGGADSTIFLPVTENGTVKISEIAFTFASRSMSASQSWADPHSSGGADPDSDQYKYDKTKANAYLFTFLVVLAIAFVASVMVWIRFRRRQRLRARLYGSVPRSYFISGEWDDEYPAFWRGRRRRGLLPPPTIHDNWIGTKGESWIPPNEKSISDIKPTSIIASCTTIISSDGPTTQKSLSNLDPLTTRRLMTTETGIRRQADQSERPVPVFEASRGAESDGINVDGLVVAVLISMPTLARRSMSDEESMSTEEVLPELIVGTTEVGLSS